MNFLKINLKPILFFSCLRNSFLVFCVTTAFTLNTPNYIYTWSPGGETTPSITVKPSSTTNYTVDVTSGSTTCQSDVTISVNQRDIVTIDSTACDSIMWDRNWLVSTGTYFDTLQNLAGFDSIITLNLTINPSPCCLSLLGQ